MDGGSTLNADFHTPYLQTDIGYPDVYRTVGGTMFKCSIGGSPRPPATLNSLPHAPLIVEVELW